MNPWNVGDAIYKEVLRERFEKKVDRSGGPNSCHLWTGACTNEGYGHMRIGPRSENRFIGAPELALLLGLGSEIGIVLRENQCALHRCDNPPCVNFIHLYAGTHKENTQDMIAKGRMKIGVRHRGADHHGAKLHTHIDEIRERLRGGESQSSIARHFDVASNAIWMIANGQTYRFAP
jgi:hypothetical protein